MVGLEALITCRRVMAWFPGTVGDTGRYFQRLRRLNQGLDISHWRVYEGKEKCNWVCTVLSTDSTCQGAGENGMETIQRRGTGDVLPSVCETRRK